MKDISQYINESCNEAFNFKILLKMSLKFLQYLGDKKEVDKYVDSSKGEKSDTDYIKKTYEKAGLDKQDVDDLLLYIIKNAISNIKKYGSKIKGNDTKAVAASLTDLEFERAKKSPDEYNDGVLGWKECLDDKRLHNALKDVAYKSINAMLNSNSKKK